MKRQLTEDERTTITYGLRVAAEQFERYIADLAEDSRFNRLAGQFLAQAKDSRALADLIDGCEAIEITPYVEAIHG